MYTQTPPKPLVDITYPITLSPTAAMWATLRHSMHTIWDIYHKTILTITQLSENEKINKSGTFKIQKLHTYPQVKPPSGGLGVLLQQLTRFQTRNAFECRAEMGYAAVTEDIGHIGHRSALLLEELFSLGDPELLLVFVDCFAGDGLKTFFEVALIHSHLAGELPDGKRLVCVLGYDIAGYLYLFPLAFICQKTAGGQLANRIWYCNTLQRTAQQLHGCFAVPEGSYKGGKHYFFL